MRSGRNTYIVIARVHSSMLEKKQLQNMKRDGEKQNDNNEKKQLQNMKRDGEKQNDNKPTNLEYLTTIAPTIGVFEVRVFRV